MDILRRLPAFVREEWKHDAWCQSKMMEWISFKVDDVSLQMPPAISGTTGPDGGRFEQLQNFNLWEWLRIDENLRAQLFFGNSQSTIWIEMLRLTINAAQQSTKSHKNVKNKQNIKWWSMYLAVDHHQSHVVDAITFFQMIEFFCLWTTLDTPQAAGNRRVRSFDFSFFFLLHLSGVVTVCLVKCHHCHGMLNGYRFQLSFRWKKIGYEKL